ncbi:MAG: uncharacterized protein JWL70_443 [Acidimicrobiia bacterium]|nr:uncharacterized protein [Acidimicrobiia bacterium]
MPTNFPASRWSSHGSYEVLGELPGPSQEASIPSVNVTSSDPLPEGPPGSRFAQVSRRAFLRGAAIAAGTGVVVLAGCSSNNDSAKLGASTASAAGATGASAPPSSAAQPKAGPALPAAAALTVAFTYTPASTGGRVNNPYVAVWLEDSSGNLVDALGVFYKAGRDSKYLSELTRWSSQQNTDTALTAVSSATRTPGAYSMVWKGNDIRGARATAGTYFVCIEAAREHGPYSLIRQSMTLGDAPATAALNSNGELSGASADYRVV